MSNDGWIKLHRKLAENDMWLDKPFSRGQAWVDLLMMVNHKSGKIMFDGKLITVPRGSRITSIRLLSEKWGWSRTKTTNFLALLEAEKMILRRSDTKKTVITIANYGKYQDLKDTEVPQKSRSKATEKPQKSTNKNDKNDKNEKNIKGASRVLPPAVLSGEMTLEEFDRRKEILRR